MQATTAVPIPQVFPRNASADHRFYVGTAIVALAIAAVGFLPALIDGSSRRGPLTPLAAVHAAAFTGWLVLYLVQTLLASTGNLRVHRRLGSVGLVLAVVMIVLGYQASFAMIKRGFDMSGDLDRLGPVILQTPFQLLNLPLFGGLVLAAVLNRRRPDVHKRLMWLAMPPLLMAGVVHAVGHFGLSGVVAPLMNFLLPAANAVHDRMFHGRMHPVSLWGVVFFLVYGSILAVVIAPSPTWQRFVLWLAG